MGIRYTGSKPDREPFEVFRDTISKLIEEDDKVVYIDADLMGAMKTQDIWRKYPKNIFNTGIQEANMVGVACGFYLNGFKPYVHSFTPFVTRRVFDQAFVSGAYGRKSLRMIGSDAGIMATHNGGTHMCFEDVAIMRTIPGALVVDVSDPTMFGKFLESTKERPGITYLRTPRRGICDIYDDDEVFEEGKGKVICDGTDVTLVASGIMVSTCIEASMKLKEDGISARVVDIISIKPLDEQLLMKCSKETNGIVTAENVNIIGGLGSAVAEYLSRANPTKIIPVGVKDQFGCVGDEQFLRKKYGLTVESVVEAAKESIQ